MCIFIFILLTFILFYIIFIIAPSIVAYYSVFGRKSTTPLNNRKDLGYYKPFVDKIVSSGSYLSKLDKKSFRIKSYDGVSLYADYYDIKSHKTAICIHGYASGADYNFATQGEFLSRLGFNLLFINQRAHDKSGGNNIGFGLLEQYDVIKWVEKIQQITKCKGILLYGISMGCATAAYASDKLSGSVVKAMVLDCGFTSPYDQLKHDYILRHLPWRLMLPITCFLSKTNLKIDIKKPVSESLKKTKIPAFFIHGTADATVPIEQGKINFKACSSPKQSAFIEDGRHTVSFIAGGEKVQHQLKLFIDKYF